MGRKESRGHIRCTEPSGLTRVFGRPHHHYSDTHIEIDNRNHDSAIDVAEREYRARFQPNYREEVHITGSTVDGPRQQPAYRESVHIDETTVDVSKVRPGRYEEVKITEETVEYPRRTSQHLKMGYYDEDGKSPLVFLFVARKSS